MTKPSVLCFVLIAGIFGDAFAALPVTKNKESRPISSAQVTYTAHIGPSLQAKLNTLAPANSAGVVLITFNTATGLAGITDLDTPVTGLLARNGIATVGHRFETFGIISAVMTKAQVTSLSHESEVLSLWANDKLSYNLHQARVLCGVDKLRADAALTAQNGGHVIDGTPKTGTPQFSVAVIDSGIDTNCVLNPGGNTDLPFDVTTSAASNIPGNPIPTTGKVIQNVQVNGDDAVGTVSYTENLGSTDSVGHGTHCAGIIGGTGGFSRINAAQTYPNSGQTEDFSGVAGRFTGTSAADLTSPTNLTTASGVKIVGLGSGAGAFVLDALGGFEYSVNNQVKYNIRITSNSYGSVGTYDPTDPLNVAINNAYAHNMVTVFAAGNSGPGVDTISSNSKNPHVISVAAGTKEGNLASFSSRGLPADERGNPNDPSNPNANNFNAITAPGTGRDVEFDSPFDPNADQTVPNNAATTAQNPNTHGKKFYSDIISTRSKEGTYASGLNDQEFPAPYQSNYTMISGTSMACPFIAGTCALLISMDPTLTPDQVKSILQITATHMPGYEDYEVGAGFVNVYAAVDYVMNRSKSYGPFYSTTFNAVVDKAKLPPPPRPLEDIGTTPYPPATATGDANTGETFTISYAAQSIPATDYASAKTKAQTNNNSYAINIVPDPATGKVPAILDVRIQFGNSTIANFVGGNTLGLYLWSPDGKFYSSGLALPLFDAPNREVVVHTPIQGVWIAELRPVRGLAAVPVTPPTGAALPDTITGQIYRTALVPQVPPDITEVPQASDILFAIANRYLDTFADGTFQPTVSVNRAGFAQAFADNVPVRQILSSTTSKYPDVSGNLARIAEALSIPGSTLRDWDFTPAQSLSSGLSFNPNGLVSRVQAAVSLVRGLGLDGEALALSGKPVQVNYGGTLTDVIDANDGSVPASAKGYIQLALNRGILTYFVKRPPGGAAQIYFYPAKPLIRADFATALVNYRRVFSQGNSLSASELP